MCDDKIIEFLKEVSLPPYKDSDLNSLLEGLRKGANFLLKELGYDWLVYGIVCDRQGKEVVYIGITNNFEKRYKAHVTGKGAKFTKNFKPIRGKILYNNLTRSEAIKKEIEVKKWKSDRKLKLLRDY